MVRSPETAVSTVRIVTTTASVHVTADADVRSIDAGRVPIELDQSIATIDSPSTRVDVRVPEGIDLVIGTTSGRVEIEGPVGSVAVTTASGKVEIEEALSLDVRTRSGRVRIVTSRGEARVLSASGRVEIGTCGDADVTTTSGRIVLHNVEGTARAHCASGRIDITMAGSHDVDAETVSGRISISLPAGTRALIDTPPAGFVASTIEHDCVVIARSGSGRVDISTR
jgi:DUF4097 and DUF4098 domain-containing protein YvlB